MGQIKNIPTREYVISNLNNMNFIFGFLKGVDNENAMLDAIPRARSVIRLLEAMLGDSEEEEGD